MMTEYNNRDTDNSYQISHADSLATANAIVVKKVFSKVFLWMTLALAITALSAYLVAGTELGRMIAGTPLMWVFIVAELALVYILSSRVHKLSLSTATILLAIYSIVNGATLSILLLAYSAHALYSTFLITAGTFGAMALIGFLTKIDLSKFKGILMMGLVGFIIAGIVNIFLRSSRFDWIISIIGVVLFAVLTAVDVNKIRSLSSNIYDEADSEAIGKVAVLGTLTLYLDFINMFLYLLRLLNRE